MSTPEERLWDRLWRELDGIKSKLDTKVNYRSFDEFKRDADERFEKLELQIAELNKAAVTPEQVTSMIGQGLESSQARGVTKRERTVRYIVAGASIITAIVVVITAVNQALN